MKRLLLFVHQSSEMYGSDKVLLYLVQGLLKRNVYHVVVVLPDSGPLESALRDAGAEVHIGEIAKLSRSVFSPMGVLRLLGQLRRAVQDLDRLVGDRSVAVVHSNTLAVLAGMAWSALRRTPHVWHVHEIVLSPRFVSLLFPYLVSWFSDRVISNSTMTERWLLGVRPQLAKRSSVVFNGLPGVVEPQAEDVQRFRQAIGAAPADVVVALVGRINLWKGQDLLLSAISELKQRGHLTNLRFVIVGSAAPGLEQLPAQLQEQARSAGFSDRCHFLPFIDDVWPIWFGSDIAVVPSTEPEPFGMVAIEAMAAGLPVVAANHGGLLDIVVHEETGLLFQARNAASLADAIERLAADADLRKRMGRAGAARQLSLFSVSSQIDKTSTVYETLHTRD